MKRIIGYLLLIATVSLFSCAYNLAGSGGDIGDPPFPRTQSILPLLEGNAWNCSYTAYDSLGNKILPNRMNLLIEITAQYGLRDDTALVRITTGNYQDNFSDYAYQYEMEGQTKGHLIVYRSLYPLETRGLYIIGEYDGATIRLYPQEQLWLAYPADSGKTWQYRPDPLGDTSKVTTMRLVSATAKSYILDSTSMGGIRTVDSCYLYRQSNAAGDSVSYYYYNEKIGCVAYERFINGALRVTYVLKSFSNNYRYF
jgi:hypothetical protein